MASVNYKINTNGPNKGFVLMNLEAVIQLVI